VVLRDLTIATDLRPRFTMDSPWGSIDLAPGVRGAHQAQNAAMAATVALALDVAPAEVAAGLADATTAAWRMELVTSPSGVVVLNDAYNANPDSMRAALRSLGDLPVRGRRVAVLGDMLELGAHAAAEHAALADVAVTVGVDLLVAVGPHSAVTAAHAERAGIETLHAADRDEAHTLLAARVQPGDTVLLKASRGIGLETVAEALTQPGDDR
jgi:UDP-N-acetylmuramoyl-tripeptide--D-alanyl-D-alanine ligase